MRWSCRGTLSRWVFDICLWRVGWWERKDCSLDGEDEKIASIAVAFWVSLGNRPLRLEGLLFLLQLRQLGKGFSVPANNICFLIKHLSRVQAKHGGNDAFYSRYHRAA